MWKKILLGVAAVILLFVIVVAMQSPDFRIERSAAFAAPAPALFAQVNDFHMWNAWSPWAKLDPQAKNTFEGSPAGQGSIFKWSGNDKVGEGIMTITESRPSELIRLKLEFIKPFAGLCDTEFTFKPEGTGTRMTWVMTGHKNFISKAFCMFMDQDKMVGGDFEKGFASLKTIVESPVESPKIPATTPATQH